MGEKRALLFIRRPDGRQIGIAERKVEHIEVLLYEPPASFTEGRPGSALRDGELPHRPGYFGQVLPEIFFFALHANNARRRFRRALCLDLGNASQYPCSF